MEKIKSNSFISFWSFLGLGAMITIWFLPWRFQTNDDELMMWLVSGAYTGTPESYAVFIHPLLSLAFSKLYTIAPGIQWYPLTWFLVMYLSYILFQFISLKIKRSRGSATIWNLFFLALLIHFCFSVQFSIVASFAVTAGLSNRILSNRSFTGRHKFYLTDLLILLGGMIRIEILVLSLIGCAFISIINLRKSIPLKALIVPSILALILYLTNLAFLQKNDLMEFNAVNQLRSQVFDHPVLLFQINKFSDANPEMNSFANGLIDFSRYEQLNSDKLLDWKKELDRHRFEDMSLFQLGKSLTVFISKQYFLQGLIFLFFGFSLFIHGRRAFYLIIIVVVGFVLASAFTLLKIQIYTLMLLFVMMNNLFLMQSVQLKKSISICFQILLVLAILYHGFSIFKSDDYVIDSIELSSDLANLKKLGFNEVNLLVHQNYYYPYVFDNPVPFKFLGWSNLYDEYLKSNQNEGKAYLIDKDIYLMNSSYFVNDLFFIEQKGEFVQIIVDEPK